MGRTRTGMKYVPQDAVYKEAKKQGFVARSALKLEEIDQKYKLFRKGMNILDLGCAPGSWLQYAHRKTGGTGKIFGIDLDPVKVELSNVLTVVGDIYELKADDERFQGAQPFDLIQSDAMSKTTGISDSDCARSVALAEYALHIANKGVLKMGGAFVVKVFEGPGFTEFYLLFKKAFRRTAVFRAENSRKGSREVYVVGLEFRGYEA